MKENNSNRFRYNVRKARKWVQLEKCGEGERERKKSANDQKEITCI